MSGEENSKGSVYSTAEWLNNHFSIKSRGRYNFVAALPFRPGSTVLDLGCANGAWSRLIAERIGPMGHVLAIDHDADLIERARSAVRGTHLEPRISFKAIDISEGLETLDQRVDAVTMFNVGSLLTDAPSTLRQIFDALKQRNGRLLLKDSAISTDFYWPLEATVACAIRKKLSRGGKIKGYDPDFALHCRELLVTIGFSIVEVILSSYAFIFPFSNPERLYISHNARMISEINPPVDSEDELNRWLSEVMPERGSFFEQPDAIYTTTEFTYVCEAI